MANGKYSKKRMNRKPLILLLAVCLLVGTAIGGTIAWLTSKTGKITNTFTVSDIEIELTESDDLNLQMVPGATIKKDPVVTVKPNSLDSWVFIKIEESATLDNFIDYDVITGATDSHLTDGTYWNKLDNETGVYYCKVKATDKDTTVSLPVIGYDTNRNGKIDTDEQDMVFVNTTVTKEMMEKVEKKELAAPTLTFTAYAIQQYGFETADAAWDEINK